MKTYLTPEVDFNAFVKEDIMAASGYFRELGTDELTISLDDISKGK